MWRRVGGAITCLVCVLAACGKSERGEPPSDDRAGSSTGGVTSAGSGTGNTAGSAAGTGGTIAQAGRTTSGGSTTAAGGTVGGQGDAGLSAVGGEPGAPSCNGTYRACGCGCCGQTSPLACVYADLGQDLSGLIAADVATRADVQGCSAAGCSVGTTYVCCSAPPPSTESADYKARAIPGGYNRLEFQKMTTYCSWITLVQPPSPRPDLPLETPPGWSFERATRVSCISAAAGPQLIGASGKIALRVLDNACVADVHVTLFFHGGQDVDAERFDVDALPLDLPVNECH